MTLRHIILLFSLGFALVVILAICIDLLDVDPAQMVGARP